MAHRLAPGPIRMSLTASLALVLVGWAATPSAQPTVTEHACEEVIELNAVLFGRNSSQLIHETEGIISWGREESVARLDENLDVLLRCPEMKLEITGVAQSRERRPLHLARQRAEAVVAYYLAGGVEPERLSVQARVDKGGERPADGTGKWPRRADSTVLPGQR